MNNSQFSRAVVINHKCLIIQLLQLIKILTKVVMSRNLIPINKLQNKLSISILILMNSWTINSWKINRMTKNAILDPKQMVSKSPRWSNSKPIRGSAEFHFRIHWKFHNRSRQTRTRMMARTPIWTWIAAMAWDCTSTNPHAWTSEMMTRMQTSLVFTMMCWHQWARKEAWEHKKDPSGAIESAKPREVCRWNVSLRMIIYHHLIR